MTRVTPLGAQSSGSAVRVPEPWRLCAYGTLAQEVAGGGDGGPAGFQAGGQLPLGGAAEVSSASPGAAPAVERAGEWRDAVEVPPREPGDPPPAFTEVYPSDATVRAVSPCPMKTAPSFKRAVQFTFPELAQ